METSNNFKLKKPSPADFYNIEDQNENMDIIDEKLHQVEGKVNVVEEELKGHLEDYMRLSDTISNGTTQTTSLNFGMNRIQIPEISVSPKIEFEGFSYVNLLGKDGNCEDISKWATLTKATREKVTAYKQFGAASIKVISDTTNGEHFIEGGAIKITPNKYYMFSGYIKPTTKNGFIRLVFVNTSGEYIKEAWAMGTLGASQFTRTAVKFKADGNVDRAYCRLQLIDESGINVFSGSAEAYFDGIMLNEISEAEFNSVSVEQLMAKYPYVDSYACLTNPYFENRRYNLVRNGNCEEGIGYWKHGSGDATLSIDNGRFKVKGTTSWSYYYQTIRVKPNTNYYIVGNASESAVLLVYTSLNNPALLKTGTGVFNSGENSEISVLLSLGQSAGTYYFDHIMIVEGIEAPDEYKSCDLQRFIVEGQFTKDDKVKIENKKVSGLLNWKHRTLFGKDYDWKFSADYAGFKRVSISSAFQDMSNGWVNSWLIKYDGKIINRVGVSTDMIDGDHGYAYNNTVNLTVADSDTGWTESFIPNNDEVKVFMNGWKSYYIDSSSRCVMFASDTHASLPPVAQYSAVATAYVAGTTELIVEDGTKFKVGDRILAAGYIVWSVVSVTGNTITVQTAYGAAIPAGTLVVVIDDPSTGNTKVLDYCKTNIAPGYEGYRLHYKLANPEPITDTNVHVEGEIWDLVKGDNYVTVDSGIVLSEVANPILSLDGNSVAINVLNGLIGWTAKNSQLQNMPERISTVYKNQNYDINWYHGLVPPDYYGGKDCMATSSTNFDVNATYAVDYQILKTQHAQTFGSLSLSYPQSIISTLEGHSKALEQKQSRNTVLDDLIDLSLYEEIGNTAFDYYPWVHTVGVLYIRCNVKFSVPKRAIPVITTTSLRITAYTGATSAIVVNDKFKLEVLDVYRDGCSYVWTSTDAITIANIKANGASVKLNLIADCRRRV